MCGRYTATQVNPALIADRFGVREQAVPGETLGRFNVCPTEPVLAVTAPGRGAGAALGADPALGAEAARRPRADQRPVGVACAPRSSSRR